LKKGLREVKGFLAAGLEAYKAGKINETEGNFSDIYFVAFETSGLETAIRQKISSKHVFQLERLFHNLRRMALEKADVSALESGMERTIGEVSQEIARLESSSRGQELKNPMIAFSLLVFLLIIDGLVLFWQKRRRGGGGEMQENKG